MKTAKGILAGFFCILLVATFLSLPKAEVASGTVFGQVESHTSRYGVDARLATNPTSDAERLSALISLEGANAKWAREIFDWRRFQPSAGELRWSNREVDWFFDYDEATKLEADAGINILGTLVQSPEWDKEAPVDSWLQQWQTFVQSVVTRYGSPGANRIHYWEIWNEENSLAYDHDKTLPKGSSDYVKLLKGSCEAIKKADLQAKVVLGGLAGMTQGDFDDPRVDYFTYLRRLKEYGAWDYFDVVAVHPYWWDGGRADTAAPFRPEDPQPRGPRTTTFKQELAAIAALVEELGPKPIWITEIGWPAGEPPRVSEEQQANYLTRMYVLSYSVPQVEKVFWFNLESREAAEGNYSLMRPDGTPRPAYTAYSVMAKLLEGAELSQIVQDGDNNAYDYRFTKQGENIAAVWNTREPQTYAMSGVDASQVTIVSLDGTSESVALTEGQLTVPIKESPVFVTWSQTSSTCEGCISFASYRTGDLEIYLMNSDGSVVVNLTNNPAGDSQPDWSPDGRKIAFTSDRDGNSEIYLMNADGTGQVNLTNNPARDHQPAWSPDGQRIAFTSERDDGNSEVFVMNADGSNAVALTSRGTWDFAPAWSPDGHYIAFVSNRDESAEVYLMRSDGTGQTNLTNNPAHDYDPAWSPDGQHITFVSERSGNPQIYAMNADGSGQVRLSGDASMPANPTWSPDGRFIAYASYPDGRGDIYVMAADGSNPTNLTNSPTNDIYPAWPPPRILLALAPPGGLGPKPTEQPGPEILWTVGFLYPSEAMSGAVRDADFVRDGKVFLATPDGYPAAYDLATGTQIWQWEDKGTVYGTEPGVVYVVRDDQRLYALDASTGQTKWKAVFHIDKGWYFADWPLWIGSETLHLPFWEYGALGGPTFVTVDKTNGNVLWWSQDRSRIVGVVDQTLVVGLQDSGGNHVIRGLDAATSSEKWQIIYEWYLDGRILGGHLYYQGSAPNDAGAISIDSGNTLWQRSGVVSILDITEGQVYAEGPRVNLEPGELVVLNRQTGEELWTSPSCSAFVGESQGMTILSDEDLGYAWAVEAMTGRQLWENDDLRINRLVGDSRGTLVAMYEDTGRLYYPLLVGLDSATGQRKWRAEVHATQRGVVLGGYLLYGRLSELVFVEPDTGEELNFGLQLPGIVNGVVPYGLLLVQTGDSGAGTLSAIQVPAIDYTVNTPTGQE